MFHALIRGEDRSEFTIEVDGKDVEAARQEAEDLYPEATILEVFDPVKRADDIYERAQRAYDDPSYDDYDY